MYSDMSGMLARERISEFHRAADRDRLARAVRRARRAVGAPGRAVLRPRRAAA